MLRGDIQRQQDIVVFGVSGRAGPCVTRRVPLFLFDTVCDLHASSRAQWNVRSDVLCTSTGMFGRDRTVYCVSLHDAASVPQDAVYLRQSNSQMRLPLQTACLQGGMPVAWLQPAQRRLAKRLQQPCPGPRLLQQRAKWWPSERPPAAQRDPAGCASQRWTVYTLQLGR